MCILGRARRDRSGTPLTRKGYTMGIDDLKKFADKARNAVSDNRETIESRAGEAIDKVAKGDKGDKVKDALHSGLDKLTGK
ncbi:hypothetical protein [Corynebacterium provencense]|uniref:hypothetical protein n=1 Tax=Corynebacterium provencense TaxID=1737425 RepID=UPI0011C9F718|nr:hypothetical protein [Corynebacterium provencense]